jgi:hypothetical protein
MPAKVTPDLPIVENSNKAALRVPPKPLVETWTVYRCGAFDIVRQGEDRFAMTHKGVSIAYMNAYGMRQLIEGITLAYAGKGDADV